MFTGRCSVAGDHKFQITNFRPQVGREDEEGGEEEERAVQFRVISLRITNLSINYLYYYL